MAKAHIIDTYFSDEEMKVLLGILEHYRANQDKYYGDFLEFFKPETLLDLSERFIAAQKNSSTEAPVRTKSKDWISIKKEADGYHIRAAEGFGTLWDTVISAHSPDPADKPYSEALAGIKSGLKIIPISASELAQLKM